MTEQGLEFEGLRPESGPPTLLKGCVLLLCLYLPIWLPLFFLRGDSAGAAGLTAPLGGFAGLALLGYALSRFSSASRKGRAGSRHLVRFSWRQVWSVTFYDTRFVHQRGGHRETPRFVRRPWAGGVEPDLSMTLSGSVQVLVGRWGSRRTVTFTLPDGAPELRTALEQAAHS